MNSTYLPTYTEMESYHVLRHGRGTHAEFYLHSSNLLISRSLARNFIFLWRAQVFVHSSVLTRA